MVKKSNTPIIFAVMVLIVGSLACSSAKPSPKPTETPIPATTTATELPTSTPLPTATPDMAATQAYDDLFEQVKEYNVKGYIPSLDGSYTTLGDFSESWAQMNWYQWWTEDRTVSNFVYSGHFSWSTASPTPEISGCGIVFAIQPNDDHYAVFLDKSRILFLHAVSTSQYSHEVGKTRGSGRVNISSPYDADFSLVVKSNHSYVYVDKAFIGEYTLSADSVMEGKIGYTLYSGTNKDYGTKCEITESRLWTFK
jgi:hypothetical protein